MDALLFSPLENLETHGLFGMRRLDECFDAYELWNKVRYGFGQGLIILFFDHEDSFLHTTRLYGDLLGRCAYMTHFTDPSKRQSKRVPIPVAMHIQSHTLMVLLRQDTTAFEKHIALFHLATTFYHEFVVSGHRGAGGKAQSGRGGGWRC